LFYARSRDPGPTVAKSSLAEARRLEVYEGDGVCPVYCGPNAREQALSYARQRAGYGRAEIQVLDEAWNWRLAVVRVCGERLAHSIFAPWQ